MKRAIIFAVLLCAAIFSLDVFSDRIVITGKPIIMKSHPGFYSIPPTYTDTSKDYRFIALSESARVCYLSAKPELAGLNKLQLIIEENGDKLVWICYKYDPRYFEVDY